MKFNKQTQALFKLLANLDVKSAPKRHNAYMNAQGMISMLKEIYSDDSSVMKGLVFNQNPFLKMIGRDNNNDGAYVPVPLKLKGE